MRILISGGGTGGHINPGIAIADYFREKQPDCEILFIGTQRGLERELVPKAGYDIRFIEVAGFKRKLSFDTLVTVKKMFKGYSQSLKILKEFRPDAVIGTGGYVCGPVLYAAAKKGYKTFVHEQNVVPGVTVKLLSKQVDIVFTSFADTDKFMDSKNLVLSGNPVSPGLLNTDPEESRKKLGLDSRPVILAYGGSLGAPKVNDAVCEYLEKTLSKGDYQFLFATGKREYDRVREKLGVLCECPNLQLFPFIYNMAECMAASDVVISRSGAMTVSELAVMGRPAILIPSPNVAHNHQEHNARSLEKSGAAKVILESELSFETLNKNIKDLLENPDRIRVMSVNSRNSGIVNATEIIYNTVMEKL